MTFRINNNQIYPTNHVISDKKTSCMNHGEKKFSDIFQERVNKNKTIKISAHAQKRLEQRNISLNEKDLVLLEQVMDKAERKGVKDSLLIYKELAIIASIENRTIITAISQNEAKENIFTNIDSAIIV